MKLTIRIELENDDMQSPGDVAEAVRQAMNRDEPYEPFTVGQEGRVRDANGNTVGSWKVTK